DALLERAKAVNGIMAQSQVQSGLVILEAWVVAQDALQRFMRRDLKVDSQVWPYGEAVDRFNPGMFNAACKVSRQCCIDIAICQHHSPALKRGHNVSFMHFG